MNSNNLRYLSQIFSTAVFKKIVANDYSAFNNIISKHYQRNPSNTSNNYLLSEIYSFLSEQYRCEYVYKNLIFKEILKKYSLNTTVTFNEFKIADSKADLMLINGIAKVYEVKTELDDFSKLEKQLNDYQKVANEVYIVSDEEQSKKLLKIYSSSSNGLIKLTKKNKLVTLKQADSNTNNFDFDSIFKLLRKAEFLSLVKLNYGFVPDVPNTKIFRVCYELLSEISLDIFHIQVLKMLKKRNHNNSNLLLSDRTPMELRFLCNALNMKEQEYENLYNFLDNNHLCINPILEENNLNLLV